MTNVTAPQKKDFEIAVDEFLHADTEYKALQEKMLSGEFIIEFGSTRGPEEVRQQWLLMVQHLRSLQENRNTKLKSAQHAMRQAVQLTESQWRGPDGRSTELSYGPFKVTSVTHRGFDAESLLDLARSRGLLERMLEIKTTNDDGTVEPIVKQEWAINYDKLMTWLKANNLKPIIDGAYDEYEKTPQVKGPKPIAFLGDEVKS